MANMSQAALIGSRAPWLNQDSWAFHKNGPVVVVLSLPKEDAQLYVVQQFASEAKSRAEAQLGAMCRKCCKTPGEGERLMFCGRCKVAGYCSLKCQREDWQMHKKVCSNELTDSLVAVVRIEADVSRPDIRARKALKLPCSPILVLFRSSTTYCDALAIMGFKPDERVFFLPLDQETETYGANEVYADTLLREACFPSTVVAMGVTSFGGGNDFGVPLSMPRA